jgi:hypothetical protein
MIITDEINTTNAAISLPELKREPSLLPLPPQAEASDFFSINEWMNPQDDCPPNDHEW